MELLRVALLFNGLLVLALHLAHRRWLMTLQPFICLLFLPYYPGWGLALLLALSALPKPARPMKAELKAFNDLSKDRQWLESTDCYEALKHPPAWAHLLACRAYARQARFEDALVSLKKARLAPPQLPPHYAWLTMALTGSTSHLELWQPKNWPEHSILHARALCLARAGELEAAQDLWDQASEIAPEDFQKYIEEDRSDSQPVTIEPDTLEQLQRHFSKLDRDSRMAHAHLGPQALLLIAVTCLVYALHPPIIANSLSRAGLPHGLLSHLFIHYNLTHLALNMLSLAALAPLIEMLYPRRFLLLYFLSGAVAGLAQVTITPQAHLIGASGAVMSLLGARLALLTRYPNGKQLLILLLILGVQLVVDQKIPYLGGIAHIWGAFSGFLLVLAAGPSPLPTKQAQL